MPAQKTARTSHHHGNLRAALISTGMQMLESGVPFSLRAVAREVGVSQTAPYRHFPDKQHLEAAMAAAGFRELQERLRAADERPDQPDGRVVGLAQAYVRFAVEHPALYRLMFAHPCGEHDERLRASADVFAFIETTAARCYPDANAHGLAMAAWSMAHGLASLQLDGKFGDGSVGEAADDEALADRVRETFMAVMAAGRG